MSKHLVIVGQKNSHLTGRNLQQNQCQGGAQLAVGEREEWLNAEQCRDSKQQWHNVTLQTWQGKHFFFGAIYLLN